MNSAWYLYAAFAAGLFFLGLYALLSMRNMIKLLVAVALIGKGVSLTLLATGWAGKSVLLAQSLVITFIVVEVSLIATALAIVINITRTDKSLDVRTLSRLRG